MRREFRVSGFQFPVAGRQPPVAGSPAVSPILTTADWRLVTMLVAALCLGAAWMGYKVFAAATPNIELNAAHAAPRQVEEATEKAVLRDYRNAWETLATALDENRADLLDTAFVGFARNEFRQAVADQQQSGLRTRYIDHGHKLDAIFYSLEGSALELRDTAQLEVQVLDGSKVLYSEPITAHYIVLMTPAADRWQVRLLQEVPAR